MTYFPFPPRDRDSDMLTPHWVKPWVPNIKKKCVLREEFFLDPLNEPFFHNVALGKVYKIHPSMYRNGDPNYEYDLILPDKNASSMNGSSMMGMFTVWRGSVPVRLNEIIVLD